MGMPAAKQDDDVIGVDTHIVMVPTAGGPVPTPLPHPFAGKLSGQLVATVKIGGKAAARAGDTVDTCNDPSDAPVGSIIAAGTVMVGG